MIRVLLLSVISFLPLLLGSCSAFGDKQSDITITFHSLATGEDPPKHKFPFDLNGRRMFFRIVPEFSQQNIVGFFPFKASDGKTNGLTLQLDFRGKSALEIVTRQHKDEYLLAMVNAKPVDFTVVDQPVLDGIITIWQGVPDDVIKKMDKKYRRIRKGGGVPNSGEQVDMLPTTKGEKKRSYKEGLEEEKASKNPKMKEPEVPSLNLPTGPVSPSIPVEGAGAPPPPATPGEAPLPR